MELIDVLEKNYENFGLVLNIDYRNNKIITFDLTAGNQDLRQFDIADTNSFEDYVFNELNRNNAEVSIGGYLENRTIYDHSDVFGGGERRTVHLGVDLWCKSGTEVLVPLSGKIHSFNNNQAVGDYGPTIILEHILDGITFYTLYGHLSLDSIENLEVGQVFEKGDVLARVGDKSVNGSWPAHLHFQIIADMLDKKGDFFGVTSLEDKEKFSNLCPNPNLILRINNL